MNKILSLGSLMIATAAQASIVEIPAALMECTPEAGQSRNYNLTMNLVTDTEVTLNIVKTDATGTMKEWTQRLSSPTLKSRFEKMPDGQDLEIAFIDFDMGNGDNLAVEITGSTSAGPWLGVLKMGKDEGVRLICREIAPTQK